METSEIKSVIETGMARIEQKYGNELEKLGLKVRELQQKSGGSGLMSVSGGSGRGHAALRDLMADDRMAAFMTKGAPSTGRIELAAGVELLCKSTLTSDAFPATVSSDQPTYHVAPQQLPGFTNDPRRPLGLLDLLNRVPVGSNVFEWNRLSGYSNAANAQGAEGALKPRANMDFTLERAPIVTVAHWINCSLQVLSDGPGLRGQIESLLAYGVRRKLEDLVIAGPGGTDEIAGLLLQGTAFAPSFADPVDRIAEAIAEMDSDGWVASVCILNPLDWARLRTERAAGGSGDYLAGGWAQPAAPSIWNLPVVTSPALAVGTCIVADRSQCLLLDRAQTVVAASRDDGSNFTTNRVTILAEGRAGFALAGEGAARVFSIAEASSV